MGFRIPRPRRSAPVRLGRIDPGPESAPRPVGLPEGELWQPTLPLRRPFSSADEREALAWQQWEAENLAPPDSSEEGLAMAMAILNQTPLQRWLPGLRPESNTFYKIVDPYPPDGAVGDGGLAGLYRTAADARFAGYGRPVTIGDPDLAEISWHMYHPMIGFSAQKPDRYLTPARAMTNAADLERQFGYTLRKLWDMGIVDQEWR